MTQELRPLRPLTRDEVREVDRFAIHELGVPGIVLMENASLGLARVVIAEAEARGAGPVGIVCGKGNNGGDGLALARHLVVRGIEARIAYCGQTADADRAGDAGINLTIVEKAGVPLSEVADGAGLSALLAQWSDAVVLVDALYGTGLRGALREPGLSLVQALDAAPQPKVAVDIPSGLDCDSGQPLGAAVKAARTVTFVAEKAGFEAEGAAEYTGPVDVVGIGCPPAAWGHVGP